MEVGNITMCTLIQHKILLEKRHLQVRSSTSKYITSFPWKQHRKLVKSQRIYWETKHTHTQYTHIHRIQSDLLGNVHTVHLFLDFYEYMHTHYLDLSEFLMFHTYQFVFFNSLEKTLSGTLPNPAFRHPKCEWLESSRVSDCAFSSHWSAMTFCVWHHAFLLLSC